MENATSNKKIVDEGDFQEIARQWVNDNIYGCANEMMEECRELEGFIDQYIELFYQYDYEACFQDSGYKLERTKEGVNVLDEDGEVVWVNAPRQTTYGELCENFDLDAGEYPLEIYEHWFVSDRFRELLEQQYEVVQTVFGMNVWGRTCRGQAIYMDGNVRNVVREVKNLEIEGE